MCEYLGVSAIVRAREFWMCLKSVYLGSRKVKVQRVTVVEFGMYDRSGDGVAVLKSRYGRMQSS